MIGRFLSRLIGPSRRSYEAASGRPRTVGFGHHGRVNQEQGAARFTLRARARHLAANDPLVSNGVANLVSGLIGTGARVALREPDDATLAAFEAWADEADALGQTDLYGLQQQIVRDLIVDGEALVGLVVDGGKSELLHIPIEQLDTSKTTELEDGFIFEGVEMDVIGRPRAYWVHPNRAADLFDTYRPSVRLPGENVLHICHRETAGQVRGVSWLAPAVVVANDYSQFADAMLTGAKLAAAHAGFITNPGLSGTADYDGTVANGTLDGGLEPGTLKFLPFGSDIRFSAPESFKDGPGFARVYRQATAAGLGIPAFLLDGDLTAANYSSLRAGLQPFKTRCERIQYATLAPQLILPIFRRWATIEILAGRLPGPIPAADAVFPKWPSVDPAKETEAVATMLANGLTSRTRALSELGWSAADVDAEIAADRAREKALGLSFGTAGAPTQKKESPDADVA